MAGSTRDDIQATLATLRLEYEQEIARLTEASARWLSAKAGRLSTTSIDNEIRELETLARRIDRKIQRQEKRLRRN